MDNTEENKMNIDKTKKDKSKKDKAEKNKSKKDKTKKDKPKKDKTKKDKTEKDAKRKRKRKPKVNTTDENKGANVNSSENKKPTEYKLSMWKIFTLISSVGLILAFFFNPIMFGSNSSMGKLSGVPTGFNSNPTVSDHNVMVLTDENFDQAVSDNPIMLVEFYAPWCGHCKQLTPKYAEVADYFHEAEMPDVKIAKIDAQVNKMTAQKYRIQSYPTMKFFKNDRILDYTYTGQSSKVIVEQLKNSLSSPAVVQIDNEAQFEHIKEKLPVFMAGYFPDGVDEQYTNLAEKTLMVFGEVYFYNVNAELADKLALDSGKVALFKQFDEGRVNYEGPLVENDLFNFLTDKSLPLLSELNEKTLRQIFRNPNAKHAVIFLSKDSENFEVLTESFQKAAEEMKESEMVFSYADINNDLIKHQAKHLQLDVNNMPAFRVFYYENGDLIKFKPDTDEISAESVVDFSKKVLSGEVKKFFKSEEIPANWNQGPVKILVGKNFKKVALDENKKVFVMFYVPGTDQTEQLEPIWQMLGEYYKYRHDVVIAKMDFTANEVEGLVVNVPLVLYQSGKEGKSIAYKVSFLY